MALLLQLAAAAMVLLGFTDLMPYGSQGMHLAASGDELAYSIEHTFNVDSRRLQAKTTTTTTNNPNSTQTINISYGNVFANELLCFVIWVLIMFCVGACAWSGILQQGIMEVPLPHMERNPAFPDICAGMQDLEICLVSTCCPIVRASQNNYATGVMGFWLSMCIYGILIVWPDIFGWLLFASARLYFRWKIREKAQFTGVSVMDCCLVCWCRSCSLCQESIYVKHGIGMKMYGAPRGPMEQVGGGIMVVGPMPVVQMTPIGYYGPGPTMEGGPVAQPGMGYQGSQVIPGPMMYGGPVAQPGMGYGGGRLSQGGNTMFHGGPQVVIGRPVGVARASGCGAPSSPTPMMMQATMADEPADNPIIVGPPARKSKPASKPDTSCDNPMFELPPKSKCGSE